MDRRTFLKSTTVAAGSGLALSSTPVLAGADPDPLAAPALSRGTIELTFAAAWEPDVPVFGDAAQRMLTRLGQLLDGRCHLVAVEASEEADLVFGPVSVEQDPAFAFFCGLPGSYGLDLAHLQAWLVAGGGQMLWDDLAARHGLKPLLAGHTGQSPGLWTACPIRSAADLAGVSLAVGGPGASVASKLGAIPCEWPASQLRDGLANRELTAVEWGNPLAGLMLGLPQVATHFHIGGIHRNGMAIAMHVRMAIWERLDQSTRLALEALAAHELAVSSAESLSHACLAEQVITAMPDLEVVEFPPMLATAIDQATAALIEEIGVTSPDSARIRDSYVQYHRQVHSPQLV